MIAWLIKEIAEIKRRLARLELIRVPNARISKTPRGTIVEPITKPGGSSNGNDSRSVWC